MHVKELENSCQESEPSGDSYREVLASVKDDEEMGDNVEDEGDKSNGIWGHGSREVLEVKIGQRTHHIFIHNRIGLRVVLVFLDSLFSFRSNVVFEKSTTGHLLRLSYLTRFFIYLFESKGISNLCSSLH